MPFDASDPDIVRLDYNFTKYVEGCRGTTPEPTEEMIYNFQDKVRSTAKLLGRDDISPDDAEATTRFLRSLSRDDMKKVNSEIFKALAELTQNQPSYEQMMELHQKAYRLGQAYMGSLMGDILNPKG